MELTDYDGEGVASIQLFDLMGRVVIDTVQDLIREPQLDVTRMQKGVYMLRVSVDGREFVQRIIIQK